MQYPQVLFLIEHVAREMDVACLVKHYAEKEFGLSVAIKHIYLHANEVMKEFDPALVVLPFFYSSTDLAISDYVQRWSHAIFVNLAWEEIFYKGHHGLKAPADDFARTKVRHHAWGPFFRDYLIGYGVLPENIFLNGNPALQLYREPYRKFYENRQSLASVSGLDPSRRWVFVPENYRWAFIHDSTIDWRVGQGANRDELIEMREFARQSLTQLLLWANRAAQQDNLEVIFRPKPATRLSEMEAFLRENVPDARAENFHLTKYGSVREWIVASDLVLSSFSTTLIEAAVAGKPCYMVEPVPLIDAFQADWYKLVPRITTEYQFHFTCEAGCFEQPERLAEWANSEMLVSGDPIHNLARWLKGLYDSKPKVGARHKAADALMPLRHWRKPVRNYFNPRTHEDDIFADVDVMRRTDAWSRFLG